MSREERFFEIISGRRRGLLAASLRGGLAAAEIAYGAAVYVRNRRYDRSPAAVHRVAVPVVSVGNLTTGGTGKTPLVAWIARWFRNHQVRVTLISRGYGAEAGARNDEALELELQLPDVPHVQQPDRVAAAQLAIEELDCELIVLDDAFQHRRLHRDLDLVLIDALAPFGYRHLLPRGLLREPLSALRRAQLIALSRADLVTAEERAALRAEIQRHAPHAGWLEVAHRPRALVGIGGESTDLLRLRGQRVAAFCGIGNPLGFQRLLVAAGAEVAAWRTFPDHHAYDQNDVASLVAWINSCDVELVLCTMKDFVKLRVERVGRTALRALAIEAEILAGMELIEARLAALLALRDRVDDPPRGASVE